MVEKRVSLSPILRSGNSQKSLGARSESAVVGWWQECFTRRGTAVPQAMCGSVRYSDAETTVPACQSLSRRFPLTAPRNLCKTYKYKWPATLCQEGMISLCNKPSMPKNSENVLTAPRKTWETTVYLLATNPWLSKYETVLITTQLLCLLHYLQIIIIITF
jgi:hypothetical protein